MQYRREIDGIRALAVLPVILFHAGFETFSGGFVGVDVFFVISGFLITTIIISDLDRDRFTILNFYERRARRIMPALFLVLLTIIPLGWFLLMPDDFKALSASIIAVSMFASNFLFWRESGYFDVESELKPLLHTWSLSVEEQYYLLFPLFLALFWRIGKRWIGFILGLVFIASLAASQYGVSKNISATFFFLPTRGWELLIGALGAMLVSRIQTFRIRIWQAEILGCIGLAMVILPVFNYSGKTPFPGLYALIPTMGTLILILFCTQETFIGRILGTKILVSIGLMSYSAYLWHQPIFVFARYKGFANDDKASYLGLILLTFFLAFMSWKYVETPFRKSSTLNRNSIFVFTLSGMLFFASFGFYVYNKEGNFGRLSAEQNSFLSGFENGIPDWNYFTRSGIPEKYRHECDFYDISNYRLGKHSNIARDSIPRSCYTKSDPDSKTIFIWGDSHAMFLYYGLRKNLSPDYEILQVTSSGCPARIDAPENKNNHCDYSNWFAYNMIKKIQPDFVLIGQNRGHDFRQMQELNDSLRSVGVKKVVFVGPVPHWKPSLPIIVTRMFPDVKRWTFNGIDKSILTLDRAIKKQINDQAEFTYVSLIDYFCNDKGCRVYFYDDVAKGLTSYDYGHLTPDASDILSRDLLAPVFRGR